MQPPADTNLHALDNAQLLELVRKYQILGYSEQVRDRARDILEKRGLDQQILRRLGYLRQGSFETALKHYLRFRKHSKYAFGAYGVLVLLILTSYTLEPNWVISSLLLGIFAGLLGFIFLSLLSQSHFYRCLDRSHSEGNPMVFLFLGMPLYFLMYAHYRNQMEKHLQQLA
ncbi:hypothetical protein [Robiginitalea marina]|uniref:DUF2157 domain-containing protein n=1 Tax=Robiginitalea marina TaxID=2954105 RepID=A0ABT1AZ04_9FLAO|nr:hypothetical protein [Robiginitalea marina]MCO5725275.1 hypothetical protein [Robiginitalea marina]